MTFDVLSAYSTAATAIATLILVIVTAFLVKATKQLTDVTAKMWLAQDKPLLIFENISTNVYVDVEYAETGDEFSQNIYVKNIGKGHAFNIKFEFYHLNDDIEKYSLDFLPSNDKKFLCIQQYLKFKNSRISYEDINGVKLNQLPYTTWSKRNRSIIDK